MPVHCLAVRNPKDCISMRHFNISAAALLSMTAAATLALAQAPSSVDTVNGARPGHEVGVGDSLPRSDKASNITPADTRSNIAPTLPQSAAGENAATFDYLRTARASLVAGHTGQAQQSLEMAETRALDRSVPQGRTDAASNSRLVARIHDARHALGIGNSSEAIELIDLALSS
jgi:hypothetical protein